MVWVDNSKIFDLRDYSDLGEGELRLGIYSRTTYFDDFELKLPIGEEHGIIISYSQGGSTVKIGLDGVVFPEGSIPSPKNRPVFIVTPFRARQIKLIE